MNVSNIHPISLTWNENEINFSNRQLCIEIAFDKFFIRMSFANGKVQTQTLQIGMSSRALSSQTLECKKKSVRICVYMRFCLILQTLTVVVEMDQVFLFSLLFFSLSRQCQSDARDFNNHYTDHIIWRLSNAECTLMMWENESRKKNFLNGIFFSTVWNITEL